MAKTITVKKVNGRWAIIIDGQLVEGGFFTKDAALRVADEYAKESK